VRITNRQSFVGLDAFDARWSLLVNGAEVRGGRWRLPPVAPHSSVEVPLPCAVPAGTGEVHLSVCFTLRRPTWYAEAGHLAAWDQVTLRPAPSRPRAVLGEEVVLGDESARSGRKSAQNTGGEAVGGTVADVEGFTEPQLCIFRAPVDNDGFKLMPELSRRIRVGGTSLVHWQDIGADRLPAERLVQHKVRRVATGQAVEYHHRVVVPDACADLARVGVTFTLPAGFEQLRWFGRGPFENYPDRNSAAMLGIWEGAPDEPPYLVPQEFGLRTDCRWFEFIDASRGRAVRLDVLTPHALHVSATHFTADDLYRATTETELRPRPELVVHVDVAHRGLGTASCGPDVLAQYRVSPGTHRFAYRLSLLTR
jgi:beta-galactosidase